jgi:hypothetical protein
MKRIASIALFALLCSCSVHLRPVPYAERDFSVLVVEHGTRSQRVLQAESVEGQRLAEWLNENANGWHVYYATTPVDGIFVSTQLGSLQFTGTGVIAQRHEGQYWKAASEDIYRLLRGADGT